MRLAVDARLVDYQQAGIATYTRGLLENMPAMAPDARFIALRSRRRRDRLASAPNLTERVVWTPPHHRWEQIALPVETALARPDLVHSPDFVPCFRRRWRAVITVHDLAFLRFPQVLTAESRRYYGQAARACRSADRVIAVSHNTARDVVDLLGIPPERVRVVYEAAAPHYRPLADAGEVAAVRQRYGAPDGYFLFVSTIEPRKNLATLLRAFARLRAASDARGVRALRLLVVGRQGWLCEDVFRLARDADLVDAVRFVGGASAEELLLLYNGALALAYPSLYEGFGLPPLEAMACGTPVLCADTSSLPEVVGDAGLLLPPLDVDAWAGTLARVVSDQGLRLELGRRGLARAALFSWRKAAAETLAVYREALRRQR